jgi:hypothetical protein
VTGRQLTARQAGKFRFWNGSEYPSPGVAVDGEVRLIRYFGIFPFDWIP